MDDEKENFCNPERPEERDHTYQLYTDNMFAYGVENPERKDKGNNLLLAHILWTSSGRIKKIPKENMRNK